ncbi:uncharacterized protein [Spinacia oleracea]|uniref:Uncharacterized protein isoform X1 n=1 Tax=Spinacia oleracea TaxID=3562 RepID=A0ABM3RUQ4_SPIOL|nr:uncharacterized protein LOC110798640 isoform X1 [Spinacia oleracea]
MSHKIVMNLYSYASKTIFRNIGETGRPPSSHSSTSLRDSPPFPSPPIHFSLSSVLPRRNGCFLASPSFWSPLMWFLLLLLLRYCLWCCFAFSFSFPVQSTIVVSNCRIRQPTTQLVARILGDLVDKYEEMIENFHPGLGDHRWLLVTNFVDCKPCIKISDLPCGKMFERDGESV